MFPLVDEEVKAQTLLISLGPTVADFIFLGSKITADSDCSLEKDPDAGKD